MTHIPENAYDYDIVVEPGNDSVYGVPWWEGMSEKAKLAEYRKRCERMVRQIERHVDGAVVHIRKGV